MWIVASAAPELCSTGPLARALIQVFHVAGDAKLGGRARAYEHGQGFSEAGACDERLFVFARPCYANFAGEVALLTNAIALGSRKLCRIHHGLTGRDVIATGTVAALAGNTAL